jgi:PBSX family phage terminase large subunit
MSTPTKAQRVYQPFGAALKLFYCKDDEVLLDGPAGTGKSRACLEKLNFVASKYAGCRILMVRKTRASMSQSTLVTWETKVLPEGSPIAQGPGRSHRQSYVYPNGSEVVIAGMDNPVKIMSTEYDLIYIAEATELNEEDWESLTTRLRNKVVPYQQLIADCNPAGPAHWLNQRCLRKATTRLLSRHEDNPTVDEAYLTKLRNLTGVRRKRLYEGVWAAQEGLVYEYDAAVHLLDRFDIPSHWRRFRVIDFGFNNPFVCQWWAVDGDGRMYRYRELYRTQRLVEDHCRDIIKASQGETYEATIADHDAEDRATAERHGIPTIAAYKALSTGIQAVQARLAKAGDGKPRLYLLEDSLLARDELLMEARKPASTEEEFDGYHWPKGQNGKTLKEEPVKLDDHGMDALRYAVAYVDQLGPDRVAQGQKLDIWKKRR